MGQTINEERLNGSARREPDHSSYLQSALKNDQSDANPILLTHSSLLQTMLSQSYSSTMSKYTFQAIKWKCFTIPFFNEDPLQHNNDLR